MPLRSRSDARDGILVALCLLAGTLACTVSGSPYREAPPPVTIIREESIALPMSSFLPEDKYSIGEPTDEEQAFVEYINHARADANAEALRLANTSDPYVLGAIDHFGVNLIEMFNQFATLEQQLPPLSIHSELTAVARLHSEDMLANVYQGHVSSSDPPPPFSPGDTLALRIAEFDYTYSSLSENVYAYGKSVYFSHAGFEIDWGAGADGMQDPPDHRETIHDPIYREIGVGVALGTNGMVPDDVGPLIVTQNFGSRQNPVPFITGVAYFDLNGNNFYDQGEGLEGVIVEVIGSPNWAETVKSGGYSVPVPGDGPYSVVMSGLGIYPQITYPVVSSGMNVKQDMILEYSAPVVDGPNNPVTGTENYFRIDAVPGATSFEVKIYSSSNAPWLEGAENGSADLTIYQSSVYDVIQSERVTSGTFTFHLAHAAGIAEEIIRLNHVILPTASSELQFSSRLQRATVDQFAVVDISTDEGATWISLYSQAGTGSSGEITPVDRSISLSNYENVPVMIRFRYSFRGGSLFSGTEIGYGWLIDDITVSNAALISPLSLTEYTSTVFAFNPPADGGYVIQARPINFSRRFPYGTLYSVTASTPTADTLQAWRAAHFSAPDLADPAKEATVWGNDADPELDGLNNLMEYALDGDPNVPDAGAVSPVFNKSAATLTLSYTMHRSELVYRVLTNTTLGSTGWTATGVTQTPDPETAAEGTPIEATATLDGPRRFLKFEVTIP